PAIEVLLIRLLRSPAVVVHHDRHDPDAVPYRGLELLGVHQVAAVAVDRDDWRLRATELGAQCRGEGEAEAAEIERGEKRARPREMQSIVSVGRSGSGVERDDRLRRGHATKRRIKQIWRVLCRCIVTYVKYCGLVIC